MAVKIADTFKPNNSTQPTGKGTFPVGKADDIWFNDDESLQEKLENGSLGGSNIQKEILPIAAESELGKIYQYIGTTGTYTHGCFYECIETSGSYDWKILQTVENCVIYTDRNIVDSTVYPFGTVVVYTGEPQWGFFKGHHYMYVENQTLTLYKFNCNFNGARVSVVFTDKELKVGTTRLRDFDGYIVDYVSEINGDTATTTDRGGSTESLTDLVFTGETEDITFTGWVDIGGGGSDGGTDYEEFIGTQAEWDALSQAEKDKYDGKIVNITDDAEGENLDYYSTTETKTNKVWIDGKPIYRKVVTNIVPNTHVSVSDDLETVTNIFWSATSTNFTSSECYTWGSESGTVQSDVWRITDGGANNNKFYCRGGGSIFGSGRMTLVVEYTKTTD